MVVGTLFGDTDTCWNVGHLPSALSRLLPNSDKGLPGVNTPYLYFGMWRATFAWHVEDMDLFSINYIHFGAPKFWYAVPQGRASALEQTLRSLYLSFSELPMSLIENSGYFPKDASSCAQFLRHKSFFASPSVLSQSSCRPNTLVQHAGEFVITYPRGYHAGFNLGLNCAESVNFALESWIELGRKAKACSCVDFRFVLQYNLGAFLTNLVACVSMSTNYCWIASASAWNGHKQRRARSSRTTKSQSPGNASMTNPLSSPEERSQKWSKTRVHMSQHRQNPAFPSYLSR